MFWEKEEKEFLLKHYGKLAPADIAKKLNRTVKSVGLKAYYLGVTNKYEYKNHKHSYDVSFFEKWSNNLAWLVGIMLSDGYISNESIKTRFIRIKMCDKDVIYKIKKIVRYSSNIYMYKPSNGNKTSYSITLCGEVIWQFFNSMGMDSNKSYNAHIPVNIPKEYFSHFLRGVFDGDGSIIINKDKYLAARICGTKRVVEFIREYLSINSTIHSNKSDTNFIVQYTGSDALQFLGFIYKNSIKNNRMNRKYKKYLEFKDNGPISS